jgi:two-component system, OmpR family, response regulator
VGSDRRRIVRKDIFRGRVRVATFESMTAALLLAEPETSTRDYLDRQLQSDGFHVLHASFGGEALALAERTRPDLVLCSELDLCARLREGAPGRTWNRDVPVIVLGPAGADAVDRVRAFERGADDYLHRPVVYDELRESDFTFSAPPVSR